MAAQKRRDRMVFGLREAEPAVRCWDFDAESADLPERRKHLLADLRFAVDPFRIHLLDQNGAQALDEVRCSRAHRGKRIRGK